MPNGLLLVLIFQKEAVFYSITSFYASPPDQLAPPRFWNCSLTDTLHFSTRNEPKAKRKKDWKNPAVLFLDRDTNHWFLLKRCEEKCLGFVFCYPEKLLEWPLNLGEKVVSPEDAGLTSLSQGHNGAIK